MESGFGQICPIAVACEVFAQRWTPIILRELLAGSQHFNDIHRGVPLMSRALLVQRLDSLQSHGVLVKKAVPGGRGHTYRLTDAGQEFQSVIEALGAWGQRWTVRIERDNLDPGFLMWNVRRRIALDLLPPRRTVVCIKFAGVPSRYRGPRQFWLLLERSQAELCIKDPGFETDLFVGAELSSLARVWLGDIEFAQALDSKDIELSGPRALVEAFPKWLMLSRFASVPRPRSHRVPA